MVNDRWVFGGFCETTKMGFLVEIPDKAATTLMPLVQRYVAPGSEIHTDGLRSYGGIPGLPVNPPYTHLVVNHSEHFVDPNTGACTNNVENYWGRAKTYPFFMTMC